MTVKAYAVSEAKGGFEPIEFELGDIGATEVDIAVESCGVCHSDLALVDDELGMSRYPFVPGHEVIGTVSAMGEHVSGLTVGDRVGLGWHSGYCMTCDQCMGGHHNVCPDAVSTIVGRHGGFADTVRADAPSVFRIPDRLDATKAGPLLCAGVTVFNPLLELDIRPTDSVAVIGIGGLGHLALMFANAWGCRVTAFTSESKKQDAIDMGAHDTVDSRDPDAIGAAAGRFDLILSTVGARLDWNAILATLNPRGRLQALGAGTDPLGISVLPDMMFKELSVGSSPNGPPIATRRMLDFAARNDIAPVTEHFPMSRINDAFERLRGGKARYRIVLDRD